MEELRKRTTRRFTFMEEKAEGGVSLSYASVDGPIEIELEKDEIPDVIAFLQECRGDQNE